MRENAIFVFLNLFLFFIVVLGAHCDIYKYIIVELTPPSFSFTSLPLIHGIVSAGLIFPFTHTVICTIFILLHPLPTSSPFSLVPMPQEGPVLPSCSPFLCKTKCSTGSFLVTFPCIYIYYYISIFLLSTLVSFLW
jgi:hypothetical protein